VLAEFSERFLGWLNEAGLEKTKKFYRNGCRLLRMTAIFSRRLPEITAEDAERLKFSGSAANTNCALRTLRRMLHKAEELKLIARAPTIRLMKEHGRRSLRLDDDAEEKLLAASTRCTWRPRTKELFRDIIILMRDTGMRNERELFRMRVENLDWDNRVIFVPDSKTPEGRRLVPMSQRVSHILNERCGTRRDDWVFPSRRSASGHLRSICRLFREARTEAGLPKELVLYSARHDYGTRVLTRTGNLAAVMKTMGRRDVKTAMSYQHPELEIVRAAIDYRAPIDTTEMNGAAERTCGTFHATPENDNAAKLLRTSVDTPLGSSGAE